MRKSAFLIVILSLVFFQYCSSSKKAQAEAKVTYASHVQPIISTSCSPCHIPPGKMAPLHTYANAMAAIDNIIDRIQKKPGEKGFMPFKHTKLADSTIQVFVRWKQAGLLEKM